MALSGTLCKRNLSTLQIRMFHDIELSRGSVERVSYALQGIQTTQILHTNSEDCSTDSPVHAKVEEQSTFRVSLQILLVQAARARALVIYAS